MAEKAVDLPVKRWESRLSCLHPPSNLSPERNEGQTPAGSDSKKMARAHLSGMRRNPLPTVELIQRGEVERFLKTEKVKTFRIFFIEPAWQKNCQGGFCIYRLLGVLHELGMARGDSAAC